MRATLVLAAAAMCALAWAGSAQADGTSASGGSAAASGGVSASNTLAFQGGPSSVSAQAQQIGDAAGGSAQHSAAASGHATAGSTTCEDPCGGASSAVSRGALARSGRAAGSNDAALVVGASSAGRAAAASQIGSELVLVFQFAGASSGDAVAGSVLGGRAGLAHNSAVASIATSGDACAAAWCGGGNVVAVRAGPEARFGRAAQVGHDDAVLVQSSGARTGDAVSGSTAGGGLVDNAAMLPSAASGPAVAGSRIDARLGPTGRGGTAAHAGDTGLFSDQDTGAASGDAIAGSQVHGAAAAERGGRQMVNRISTDADAVTGPASSTAGTSAGLGPTAAGATMAAQTGQNVVTLRQSVGTTSGSAIAD